VKTFLCVVLTGVVLLSARQAAATEAVLWNRLGSVDEVLHSEVGPDLAFYSGGGGGIAGNPDFGPGYFGGAVTLGDGSYHSGDRVHNVVLQDADQYLNPDEGAVELWYKQEVDVVPYHYGIYRAFGGSYGLGSGIGLEEYAPASGGAARLRFWLQFGGPTVDVQSIDDGDRGYNISGYNGTWIHLAAVWDRAGIEGTADTMRLYVNGEVVAVASEGDWGSTVGSQVDIAGGNDAEIAHKFYVDNLKLWDFPQTDYSHRFEEDWIPEPGAVVLLGAGGLVALRRRRRA